MHVLFCGPLTGGAGSHLYHLLRHPGILSMFLEILFFFFLRQTVGKGCCKIRVNVEVKFFFFSHNVTVSIDTRGSKGTGSGMNFI